MQRTRHSSRRESILSNCSQRKTGYEKMTVERSSESKRESFWLCVGKKERRERGGEWRTSMIDSSVFCLAFTLVFIDLFLVVDVTLN